MGDAVAVTDTDAALREVLPHPEPDPIDRSAAAVQLAGVLRRVGCVFAEDEAEVLLTSATGPGHLDQMVAQRGAGLPLEQIVGWVDFAGLRLHVGDGVFVPRQRSVHLVRIAADVLGVHDSARAAPVLLEMCCGVAPLAAAVHHRVPGVELHASDLDPRALGYARRNLPAAAGVYGGHLFDGLPRRLRGRVTLLVAVPPYVPVVAAGQLPREARDHEPLAALLSGADGLDLVRELVEDLRGWLAPDGRVLLEIHASQHRAAAVHAAEHDYSHRRHPSSDGQTSVLELRPAR